MKLSMNSMPDRREANAGQFRRSTTHAWCHIKAFACQSVAEISFSRLQRCGQHAVAVIGCCWGVSSLAVRKSSTLHCNVPAQVPAGGHCSNMPCATPYMAKGSSHNYCEERGVARQWKLIPPACPLSSVDCAGLRRSCAPAACGSATQVLSGILSLVSRCDCRQIYSQAVAASLPTMSGVPFRGVSAGQDTRFTEYVIDLKTLEGEVVLPRGFS